jgi:hypothetical protein
VVDEDLGPPGANHTLLPGDRSGASQVNDREQATAGVCAVLAGELKCDDPARSGQRFRKAFGWCPALIGVAVAGRGALGRVD